MIHFDFHKVTYNKSELIIILRHIADQIEKGIINEDYLYWKLSGEDQKTGTKYVHCGVPMAEIENYIDDEGNQIEVYKCRICGEEE